MEQPNCTITRLSVDLFKKKVALRKALPELPGYKLLEDGFIVAFSSFWEAVDKMIMRCNECPFHEKGYCDELDCPKQFESFV